MEQVYRQRASLTWGGIKTRWSIFPSKVFLVNAVFPGVPAYGLIEECFKVHSLFEGFIHVQRRSYHVTPDDVNTTPQN